MPARFFRAMHSTVALLLLSQLSPPPLVEAEEAAPSPPPLVESAPQSPPPLVRVEEAAGSAPSSPTRRPLLGLALDAAAPDGAGLNLVVRPLRWLELHGGVTHNAISPGVRGGFTLLPVDRWFVPTLTLEAGTHPPGDANRLVQRLSRNERLRFEMLDAVGYDYANALAGFTFGSRQRYTIYLRGGVSRLQPRLDAEKFFIAPSTLGGGGGRDTSAVEQEPLFIPALKLGFALYFF